MEPDNLEKQIPLILYRLDTTAQVLENIKEVLDRQTENLSSLLVLQEKHNNLQLTVNDLKLEIDSLERQSNTNSNFVEKFYGGLYVALFVFSILQTGLFWWISDTRDQLEAAKDANNKLSSRIEVIEKSPERKPPITSIYLGK